MQIYNIKRVGEESPGLIEEVKDEVLKKEELIFSGFLK